MGDSRTDQNRLTTINGVDVAPLYQNGGEVNIFEQKQETHKTRDFKDGFCASFNTSTLIKLFSCKEGEVKNYTTVSPLRGHILDDIMQKARDMIALSRDGNNINHAPFLPFYKRTEIRTQSVHINDLSRELKKVKAATLTYKTKNGDYHQLAFYRYDSDKCYIMDANRLVAIKTPVEASINVLIDIIKRSNPNAVELTSVPIKIVGKECQQTPVSSTVKNNNDEMAQSIEINDEKNDKRFIDDFKTVTVESFFYSFLTTISNEFVTDYLRSHNYQTRHIDLINQTIDSLTLIAMGGSLRSAVLELLVNELLIKSFNLNERMLRNLVSGIVLIETAISAIRNPPVLKNHIILTAAGWGASIIGNLTANYAYGLIKNGIFAETEPKESCAEESFSVENYPESDAEVCNESSYDFEIFCNKQQLLL